ncbi:MAG: 30S ribosomal protein S13 [Candidatus Blackburnbacteria bacterium]|nr:30S ribosomal protein S13 [Candidatus Blackburnbacteria bacterium]
MARIVGIELPENARIDWALTRLYGIGWVLSEKILKDTKIPSGKRTKDLTDEEVGLLNKAVEQYKVEGDLRREIRQNLQRLKDTGSYRGMRHSRNLPVRGQRTKTNARTKRGKRKTIGAFKKEALARTAGSRGAKGKETVKGKE